jgi:hypothetical protein
MTIQRALVAALLAIGIVAVAWRWTGGERDRGAASLRVATTGAVPPPRGLLGAGSCTSSGCHAAAEEGHLPWQSAFTVWSSRDPHARAHRVLREPLAARIVAALAARHPGQPVVPAVENVACIGCHATGRGPQADAGVSCESCHGAAGDWLVPHTQPGWRTVGNRLGMVDLADPAACATRCAGCHVGGPPTEDGAPREVSHDLIAAGHPRLAFELRSFKRAEPPHWRDRFAAGPGDPPLDCVDEWALGRLGTLRSFLEQVRRQAAPGRPAAAAEAGVWPEFTAFDCYSCHRPAVAAADRGRIHSGPLGTPRLEPLHWSLLDMLLPPEQAGVLAAFRGDVEQHWWQAPDPQALDACLRLLDAATAHAHPGLADVAAGMIAGRVVAATDPANWDESAAALAALEAVVDRSAARRQSVEAIAPARGRLDELRRLLEFPVEDRDGRRVRFDSPQAYDADAVGAALRAAATAIDGLR